MVVSNQGRTTVALDIQISEKLKNEGIARELVNRIQNRRKDENFEVTDQIQLFIEEDTNLKQAVVENEAYIKAETLTKEILFEKELVDGVEIAFDHIESKIKILNHKLL